MAKPVEAPKLGNSVEECLVTKWCKLPGDQVSAGEVLLEIETDKTTFEVAAPVGGTLLATFFEEGAIVPVFANLCVIGEPGENVDSFRPTPSACIGEAEPLAPAPPPAVAASSGGGAALSPRAGKFAREHGFHTASVAGSGPGGRVLEADVKRAMQPGSGIRERIARRMRESLASTAQYTLHTTARATGLLAARARFKASALDININDLVAYCAVKALLEAPALNAEFVDGKIHTYEEVHLGFACDTPRGLLVPVIRDAHRLTIGELATQAKDLAAAAVAGKIPPDRLSGATFTISNLGGLGAESFTPLLNPPQVAILGVGSLQVRPVRREAAVEFVDVIGLSLTCDHQVIDGAPGARFLQLLREKIEHVESLCSIV